MTFETLKLERRGSSALLTLHRPDRLNAINGVMSRELEVAWSQVKSDPEVAVVVVTGAGEKALSTGFDVADVAAGSADFGVEGQKGKLSSVRLTALHNRCWKPVITAVNGMCCAGGLHFVADSDLVIAAEHATFFDPHVGVGLVAGLEPIGLARRMALEPVLRMALVGARERMSAKRAFELGLVGEVVPKESLLTRAFELAALIGEGSPAAIATTKRALWESLDGGLTAALAIGQRAIDTHRGHPDGREGALAFREKRQPRWQPLVLD